jgi:hypothetical protein
METLKNNFETVTNNIYNNQQFLLNSFNNFLNDNVDFKKEFFKATKEEQDNLFGYVVNSLIGRIAIEETFKN